MGAYTEKVKGIKKIKIIRGHPRAVCDFCNKHGEGESYRLASTYRTYRFLNVCPACLARIRKGFRKKR